MPTSTVWRRNHDLAGHRGASPVRPSAEVIERLSPDPASETPTLEGSSLPLRYSPQHGYSSRGLGLSDIGSSEDNDSALQPDHLYYDQDGAAHIAARIKGGTSTVYGRSRVGSLDWATRNSNPTSGFLQDSRRLHGKGHTRSGSTIDDLATAAIATSPVLASATTLSLSKGSIYNNNRHLTSYTRRYSHEGPSNGPPAKRIKSERLPTLEWSPRAERPKTSGGYSSIPDVDHEDALLLLELKNEVNFKNHANTPKLDTMPEYPPSTSPSSPQSPSKLQNPQQQERPVVHLRQSIKSRSRERYLAEDLPNAREVSTARASESIHKETAYEGNALDARARGPRGPQTAVDALPPVSEEPLDSAVAEAEPLPKKQRRIKPEQQAEVCAACQRLQLDSVNDEDTSTFWISCDACKRWFHAECAGFKTKADARSVDKYVCKDCEPIHGQTTYVRKSSRPRTAIDYAGLNQGVVKSSVETSTHHYIQPIKEGKINVLPDDFARIRPELLTMEFMESFEGPKRPFVVPAEWNPRFGVRPVSVQRDPALPTKDAAAFTLIDSHGAEVGPDKTSALDLQEEEVIDCDQDLLDMVIPRDLTVRKVAELYGPEEPVPVIDVKSQETKGYFTLQQWADYYELEGEKPIRNVISLEVSHSPLGRLIRRPKVVRDLDLDDQVWEADADTRLKKRPVSFYCLMSVADSYTDFHIDFGGSSVYYHILRGTKTFFFIPPEDRYLKKYEEWCNSGSQNETWLGDLCGGNCTRVDLHEGDTAFIPAGWIHSVWTPEDSLVIGGNYLTRLDYEMQLKVVSIEKATKVAPKFRYPYFQKVMWYALIKYLDDDPVPEEVLDDFHGDPDYVFLRANPIWHEIGEFENTAEPGDPAYNSRYYPKSEANGWPALRDFLYRTARIDAGLPVPDITKKQIDAVKASIPKGYGDPLMMIKIFAIWCAWKIGNTTVPDWVHSDSIAELERGEKSKKAEPFRVPGERISSRRVAQAQAQAQALAEAAQAQPRPLAQTPPAKNGSRGNGLRVASGAAAFTNGAMGDAVSPEARISDGVGSEVTQPDPQSSSKKSRSKACEDCRKSKRRCVHDQYGRIDPAKVAEPSKPRGSASAKRATTASEESKQIEPEIDNFEDLIDPALTNGDASDLANDVDEETFHTPGLVNNRSPAGDGEHVGEDVSAANEDDSKLIPIDPALGTTEEEAVPIKSEHDQVAGSVEPSALQQNNTLSTPNAGQNGTAASGELSGPYTWTPGSRQSSRQPKQVERYTPEDKKSPSKPYPKPQRNDRRASSAASAHTVVTSIKTERSSSNTSGTTHQMAGIMTSKRSPSLDASARPDAFELFHLVQEADATRSSMRPPRSHALEALGHALSGSFGASISNAALYPIDLIITRLQIQRQLRKDQSRPGEEEYKGFFDGLQKIYHNEGGVAGLYTGLLQDTGKTIADSFLFFLIYSFLRDRRIAKHTRLNGGKKVSLPALEELGVGFVAGSLTKLATAPIANIVTRKQAAALLRASEEGQQESTGTTPTTTPTTRQIARDILSEKGPLGFWSGYSASLVLTLNPTITFFLFETLKKLLLRRESRQHPPPSLTFLLSAISKACASSITYPFSLAKSRLQAGGASSHKEDQDENEVISEDFKHERTRKAARATIFSTVLTIAQTEGVAALYEGLHVEVLRAFFSHGITMLVKQIIQRFLVRAYYLVSVILGRYKKRRDASAKRLAEKAKASVEYYNLAMARASEKIEEAAEKVKESVGKKANETAEFVGEYVEEDDELGEKWKELYGTVGLSRWFDKVSDER
ncbi:hypothetical protein AYO20_02191 [Fonsecaea nubica]|uniref:JmjC domain-containing histone demethylation protein 1 n=1 Tax=Fonsecaea nubica TaxID=856822 RepID=A0A178DBH3_9EURO|nr:hypothetical protein AYO20_02191 [Fonsecaea nubica]OAL38541.1 hypothetical protein AYO20_02191 [Fonsecaea nubica]